MIGDELRCKDLATFKDYPIENILLIDNKCMNFYTQPRNGFPVSNYDINFIMKRECGINAQTRTPTFSADLTLYRLNLFMRKLSPDIPLQ
jgi:hypothetical protein